MKVSPTLRDGLVPNGVFFVLCQRSHRFDVGGWGVLGKWGRIIACPLVCNRWVPHLHPYGLVRDDIFSLIVIPHRCFRLKQHSRKTADAGPIGCMRVRTLRHHKPLFARKQPILVIHMKLGVGLHVDYRNELFEDKQRSGNDGEKKLSLRLHPPFEWGATDKNFNLFNSLSFSQKD